MFSITTIVRFLLCTDSVESRCIFTDAKDNFVLKVIGKNEHCNEILQEDKKIAQAVEEDDENNKRDVEWKRAAAVLNDLALILHVTVVLLTFAVMFFEVLFIAKS